jgi:hypothetical protein
MDKYVAVTLDSTSYRTAIGVKVMWKHQQLSRRELQTLLQQEQAVEGKPRTPFLPIGSSDAFGRKPRTLQCSRQDDYDSWTEYTPDEGRGLASTA